MIALNLGWPLWSPRTRFVRWPSVFYANSDLHAISYMGVYLFMIIVSWNVREVSNPLNHCRIKNAMSELRPDWFDIQKSKLNDVDSSCIAQLIGWYDVGYAWSPTINRVRGIICCWNLANFRKTSRFCQSRFVVVKGSWIAMDGPETIICIYAPTDLSERVAFFVSLGVLCCRMELPGFCYLWWF